MKTIQTVVGEGSDLAAALSGAPLEGANLVLVFGDVARFSDATMVARLRAAYPGAILAGCSTAGEISGDGVSTGTLCVTAVAFGVTSLRHAVTRIENMSDSHAAGRRLGEVLSAPELKAVLVYGPGVNVNGSALVAGMASCVGPDTPISGGLAGDGGAFRETWTLSPDGVDARGVVAIGLYGSAIRIGHGSYGGWEPFGPARKVTRSEGNVLFELDGKPALDVYKRYLGEHAKDLPASGLLFPFAMLGENHDAVGLIRTILGVNEADGSLTLAGEIDPGGYLKLMHASTDRLVDGAEAAAEAAAGEGGGDALAVLVSCVGRRLVMGERVDEEVEAVADVFGAGATLTGFYSYGEIGPYIPEGGCRLHNQTMTVTRLSEI